MLKVFFVAPELGLGGAERSLVKFANGMARLKYAVTIVTFSSAADNSLAGELDADVSVCAMQGRRTSDPRTWLHLSRILRRYKPEIVIGWSLLANLVVCLLCRFGADHWLIISERIYLPKLLQRDDLRARLRSRFLLQAIKWLYPTANIVTANSKENLKLMRRYIGKSPAYRYLPNIIDVAEAGRLSRASAADVPAIAGPPILSVGRLHSQKGFDVLLDAFAIVKEQRPWNLVIVGDGPEAESLRQHAEKLGIQSSVHWIGSRQDPFPYYGWADIVVTASRYEGFPNVPLEAMACGCAVICTDCKTGPRELTENGRYGRLIPVGDAIALASQIISLGDDPRECHILGEAARTHIEEHFDAGRQLHVLCQMLVPDQ